MTKLDLFPVYYEVSILVYLFIYLIILIDLKMKTIILYILKGLWVNSINILDKKHTTIDVYFFTMINSIHLSPKPTLNLMGKHS